jgi:hypothetical protein
LKTSADHATGYGRRQLQHSQANLVVLKILNGAFVFLCPRLAFKRAEIFSLAGSRIFFARVQPILPGFQFPDQNLFPRSLRNGGQNLMLVAQQIFAVDSKGARVEFCGQHLFAG